MAVDWRCPVAHASATCLHFSGGGVIFSEKWLRMLGVTPRVAMVTLMVLWKEGCVLCIDIDYDSTS